MSSFDFYSVPRIVFGCGKISLIGELGAQLGTRALVVHNGADQIAQKLLGLLDARALRTTLFRQKGEPTIEDIDRALAAARSEECDLVIGLGGGSAIDAAKAVAGLLTNGGSALDYMEVIGKGQKIAKPAAPWIAVPTTAGTGAEVTRNAVIGAPQHRYKASIRGEQLLARIALVDPELGIDVPPSVTASSGMDALCQLIEAYTSTGAQPMTDALAEKGMALAAGALQRAYRNGTDISARHDMALAALFSGIALTNAGLGAVHGFAAPLGANFPVPHGTVCAALLPLVIEANVQALRARDERHPTLLRYAQVGRLLASERQLGDDQAISAAARRTAALVKELNIPPLRQFGIHEADVPAMAQLARKASSMRYNPVELSDGSLQAILRRAL
jgi:alcohol dehydrogenase class IV